MDYVGNELGGPGFRDRKGGLIFFGIVLILIGAMMLLVGLSSIVIAAFAASAQIGDGYPFSPRMLAFAMSYSLLMAVGAIWLGIGSVLARRWARALILVSSWMWLVMGILSSLNMAYLMPSMQERMPVGNDVDTSITTVVVWIMWGTTGIIYIGLPLVFILFYGSRHVKETCNRYDPRRRWTDNCPMPVLGLSVVLVLYAIGTLWSLFYGAPFPVFGTYITGYPALLAVLILAVTWGWLALGIYKLRFRAWAGALALTVTLALSTLGTFTRVDLEEFFRESNLSTAELDQIRTSGLLDGGVMMYWILIPSVALVIYMLWVRTAFRPDRDCEETQH